MLRLLVKEGADVQVIMTPSAKEFVGPVTFSALSGKPVLSDFFSTEAGDWNSHVEMGISADLMLIAPVTATSLGKMAHGIADNLLITTYLSARCPIVLVGFWKTVDRNNFFIVSFLWEIKAFLRISLDRIFSFIL